MTSVATLKITEEGLKNYVILFDSKNNERFFNDYFYQLTGRERDMLLGYNPKSSGSVGHCSANAIKQGRYPAFRILLMCKNSKEKINPDVIRLNYEHAIECKSKNFWFVVDKNTENAVWDAICDGYDNKS
jgi:hypothetical protein